MKFTALKVFFIGLFISFIAGVMSQAGMTGVIMLGTAFIGGVTTLIGIIWAVFTRKKTRLK